MKQQPLRKFISFRRAEKSPSSHSQRGASALEYIVLAAVIVIAVSVGALLLSDGPIQDTFQNISDAITGS